MERERERERGEGRGGGKEKESLCNSMMQCEGICRYYVEVVYELA